MEEMKKKVITPGRMIRLYGLIFAVFLALGGLLYWQGTIQMKGLILMGITALVSGILFTFGVRIAQKDGFLDGYVRAKDHFDKKKK